MDEWMDVEVLTLLFTEKAHTCPEIIFGFISTNPLKIQNLYTIVYTHDLRLTVGSSFSLKWQPETDNILAC